MLAHTKKMMIAAHSQDALSATAIMTWEQLDARCHLPAATNYANVSRSPFAAAAAREAT